MLITLLSRTLTIMVDAIDNDKMRDFCDKLPELMNLIKIEVVKL